MEEYLDSKRKDGKTDSEIIKDATGKAGIFMVFSFIIIVIMVMFIIIISTDNGKINEFETGLRSLASSIFPKLG